MVGTRLVSTAFGAAALTPLLLSLAGFMAGVDAFEGLQRDNKPSNNNGYGGTIPALELVREITSSTAFADFAFNDVAYAAASQWYSDHLRLGDVEARAPYLVCAEYNHGQEAVALLQQRYSASAIQPISNSKERGLSCFLVTASTQDAVSMLSDPEQFNLVTAGPFVPTLKIAPGMLEYQGSPGESFDGSATGLRTSHGERMKLSNVRGLSVRLAPGVLPAHDESGADDALIHRWLTGLMSDEFDMFSTNFWTDPEAPAGPSGHVADHEEGIVRIREWTRAAVVVHTLAEEYGKSPGEVCSLGRTTLRYVDDDLLVVEGETPLSAENVLKVICLYISEASLEIIAIESVNDNSIMGKLSPPTSAVLRWSVINTPPPAAKAEHGQTRFKRGNVIT